MSEEVIGLQGALQARTRPGTAAPGSTFRSRNWKFAGWGGAKEWEDLVAEPSADGNALAADGTAAAQHGSAGLGLHARPESVHFYTAVAVGLKCALRHGNALLFPLKNLRFDSEFKYNRMWARNPARTVRCRRIKRTALFSAPANKGK